MREKKVSTSLKFILTIFALVTMSSFFIAPKSVSATFDPSYIIPDDVFTNSSSMTQQHHFQERDMELELLLQLEPFYMVLQEHQES